MRDSDKKLITAIASQDVDGVTRAINDGANTNLVMSDDVPILVEAAASGNVALTKALLDGGADPNFRTAFGITPLMLLAVIAREEAHLPVVRTLLDAGADPIAKDKDGQTAIEYFRRFEGHRSREIGELLSVRAKSQDRDDPKSR